MALHDNWLSDFMFDLEILRETLHFTIFMSTMEGKYFNVRRSNSPFDFEHISSKRHEQTRSAVQVQCLLDG